MTQSSEIATWWGRHRLPADRNDLWSIGSLELLVEHFESFWRLHWCHVARPAGSSKNQRQTGLSANDTEAFKKSSARPSSLSTYFPAKIHSVTIPSTNPNEDLIFSPLLPEEPLILHLGSVAVLDPGEKLTTGFMLPLSIRVETAAGQNPARDICEIPLAPMVRTWGGTTPMKGELALTTDQPSRIEKWSQLTPRLDAAGLGVTVTNSGTDSVFVDRVFVPCEKLSLFHSAQTGFWTDHLLLKTESDLGAFGSTATTQRIFPREAGATTLVSQARGGPENQSALKGLANFRTTIGNSVEHLFKERG